MTKEQIKSFIQLVEEYEENNSEELYAIKCDKWLNSQLFSVQFNNKINQTYTIHDDGKIEYVQ